MSIAVIKFEIEGVQPTIQHNGRLADPMDPFARAIAKINGKPPKQRTVEELIEKARLEFLGSCYVEDEETGGPIVWPNENWCSMLRTAGKTRRLGKRVQVGTIVRGINHPLTYKGPRTRDELWEDGGFKFVSRVKGSKGQNMTCRPIFREWSLKPETWFESEQIDEETLIELAEYAGKYIGFSAWPYRFGMFKILSTEVQNA